MNITKNILNIIGTVLEEEGFTYEKNTMRRYIGSILKNGSWKKWSPWRSCSCFVAR